MKGEYLKCKINEISLGILFFLLFSFSISFPQESTKTYDAVNGVQVKKQILSNGSSFYSGVPYDYGTNITSSATVISRSIYDVPFSFSVGDYITKVEIIYKNKTGQDGNFSLYYIPEKGSSSDNSVLWSNTEASGVTKLAELGGSSYNTRTIYIYALQEIVNNALEAGKTKIYIGFRAQTESQYVCASAFEVLQIKFTYEKRVKFTIRNSNGIGKIDVSINNGQYYQAQSDTVLKEKIGTIIKLRAKEEQFDGANYWVWNQDPNTLENTWSIWDKNSNSIHTEYDNIEIQEVAKESELNVTYTAQLWRKYVINRTDQTEFDGSFQTNDVARVVEGNSVNIPYSETLTKTTGTYYFAGWESGGTSLKTPSNNTTYTALYKMSQKSNTQSAFSNSSQRKFIRTPLDGCYHIVYESMGKIWYERSTDGGTTWTLGNNGKPLNTDYVYDINGIPRGTGSYTVAKHPAIDYYEGQILVVWQEQSGQNYVVRLAYLSDGLPKEANHIPFPTYGLYNSEDVYPEIAAKDDGHAVIAIRRNDSSCKGLEVHLIVLNPYGTKSYETCSGWIPGTDQYTGLFTLATDKSSTDKYHIAWTQSIPSATKDSMMYSRFNFSWYAGEGHPGEGYFSLNILKTVNISRATAFTQSFSPSMIGLTDGTARLSFKGCWQYYPGGGPYSIATTNPDNLGWIPYLRKYSGEVFSPQISQGTEVYFVGWTELTGGVYRTIVTDASTLRNMETVAGSLGRDMQINPGGTRNEQFSISFNSEATTLPYFFTRSTDAIGQISSNAKKLALKSGRGIFLSKEERQMYFILGNVTSDGVPVDFIETEDTVMLDGSLKKVNLFMMTKPFSMKEKSTLSFAVIYGTKDSSIALSGLKEGQFASFKVEMIDDATGGVLGSYLSEKMDKTNIFSLKEGVFKVNSDGNRLVRLRVSVDENMKSEYTISDMFFGEGLPLSKSLKEKEMSLEGSMEVKEYSISQNYPNPFNPTTMISYQIPKPSKVTLKVYDILGKEVATLVNGYMEVGKYSAQFNASSLPSGIYIYEIRASDFVKSGKMMMLK